MTIADLQIWFTFALVGAVIVSYALERVALEVTSMAGVVAVLVFFHVFPVIGVDGTNALGTTRVLEGFASPALASIMALMVIGQALYQTGAMDAPARFLARRAGRTPRFAILVTFIGAAAVSAFMNNTPVVVMLIPVMTALAAQLGTSPSRLVMPVSFMTILGGMTTLVGSSTNLLVAGAAAPSGVTLEFFDPFFPGIILAGVGGLYVTFVMPRLLDRRETLAQEVAGPAGHQYIAEIPIETGHMLCGSKSRAGLFPDIKNMTVRLVQRGEHALLPPFEDVTLQDGDIVVVAATRNAISEALTKRQPILATGQTTGTGNEGEGPDFDSHLVLAEAMIAPGSRLIGRSVEMAHLRAETGTIVLGIQRRSRMIRSAISDIRLEAGDVLLLLGTRDEMTALNSNKDVLLIEWTLSDLPRMRYAGRAIAILAVTLTFAATGMLPIAVAALGGAFAVIVAGCLNIRQAARAFDRKIYLLIGASLALAAPLEATGAANLIASTIIDLVAGYGPVALLAALFLLIAIFTNILSNHATAALFTPVAISAAAQSGVDPMVFVLTVIYAANCSFATPMAYQTNLLVMGPGRYRFMDFVRAGTPLIIIIWLVYCLIVPWYFGL